MRHCFKDCHLLVYDPFKRALAYYIEETVETGGVVLTIYLKEVY